MAPTEGVLVMTVTPHSVENTAMPTRTSPTLARRADYHRLRRRNRPSRRILVRVHSATERADGSSTRWCAGFGPVTSKPALRSEAPRYISNQR